MKFPRNTRLLRSPFEVAPFAAVFFLLAIFMILAAVLPTGGLHLQVPEGNDLSGTLNPSVSVAVDAGGRYFISDQLMPAELKITNAFQLVSNEADLKNDLSAAAKNFPAPLTLVVHADKSITYDQIVRLTLLARDSGITNVILATAPRAVTSQNK
ncbi:MAG TPA: biopolymer transporter ExbD [Verrucomicrobiae bacterium]|nr:biopolymer transporter ExbD [Verrucomicrobiae bacterium]